MFAMFRAVALSALCLAVKSDYATNDEVALRAMDIVSFELDKSNAAIEVIEHGLNAGVADITQSQAASRILFYGQKLAFYNEILIFQHCIVATKFYMALLNNGTSKGLSFQKSQDATPSNVDGFTVDSQGFAAVTVPSLGKTSYDCSGRNWVKAASAAHTRVWSAPYIYSFDYKPTFSLASPFYNAAGSLVGVVSANLNLTTVGVALRTAFNFVGSTHSAFIVDKYTGYLVATSIDTPAFSTTSTPGKYNFLLANASTNTAISSVTKDLAAKGWPTTSVLSNGYFARTLAVTSSNPGLNWYLVALIKQDTYKPSTVPSAAPTSVPTAPSKKPTTSPSVKPATRTPSVKPTKTSTKTPSVKPTKTPTTKPSTFKPSTKPSKKPVIV